MIISITHLILVFATDSNSYKMHGMQGLGCEPTLLAQSWGGGSTIIRWIIRYIDISDYLYNKINPCYTAANSVGNIVFEYETWHLNLVLKIINTFIWDKICWVLYDKAAKGQNKAIFKLIEA